MPGKINHTKPQTECNSLTEGDPITKIAELFPNNISFLINEISHFWSMKCNFTAFRSVCAIWLNDSLINCARPTCKYSPHSLIFLNFAPGKKSDTHFNILTGDEYPPADESSLHIALQTNHRTSRVPIQSASEVDRGQWTYYNCSLIKSPASLCLAMAVPHSLLAISIEYYAC